MATLCSTRSALWPPTRLTERDAIQPADGPSCFPRRNARWSDSGPRWRSSLVVMSRSRPIAPQSPSQINSRSFVPGRVVILQPSLPMRRRRRLCSHVAPGLPTLDQPVACNLIGSSATEANPNPTRTNWPLARPLPLPRSSLGTGSTEASWCAHSANRPRVSRSDSTAAVVRHFGIPYLLSRCAFDTSGRGSDTSMHSPRR